MRLSLTPHPATPCRAVTAITVEVTRGRGGTLRLCYTVSGEIDALAMPGPAAPERADDLWRLTCFEAFVRPSEDGAYFEFNLSPSGRWAAYAFSGYREGMADLAIPAPRIDVRRDAARFELEADLDLGSAPGLPPDAPWRLGLSAVIEEAGGQKSYWALAHPPGKPDFHHPDTHDLPAVEQP